MVTSGGYLPDHSGGATYWCEINHVSSSSGGGAGRIFTIGDRSAFVHVCEGIVCARQTMVDVVMNSTRRIPFRFPYPIDLLHLKRRDHEEHSSLERRPRCAAI